MHPMLIPPARRVLDQTIRMPRAQRVDERTAGEFQATLMDPAPTMRLAKTTARNRIAQGPLAAIQQFVRPNGAANSPDSIAAGAVKHNKARSANKSPGRTAGM